MRIATWTLSVLDSLESFGGEINRLKCFRKADMILVGPHPYKVLVYFHVVQRTHKQSYI